MSTILILNLVSGSLAATGIGGYLVYGVRRARRAAAVEPLYVPAEHAPPA